MDARHTLTVLNRLAGRVPTAQAHLASGLRGHLFEHAAEAVDVALAMGGPIVGLMLTVVDEESSVLSLATLGSKIPPSTTILRELAAR